MTEIEPSPTDPGFDMLAAVAAVKSEPSGVDTFGRYVWQAKQAVRQWLTCLAEQDGPLFVVCEHVEDLTLVYADRIRFLQLKTRDKGSWSGASMCARGIDALVRSYNSARAASIHELATFELWLEGAISDATETVAFAADPASAGRTLRAKITACGLKRAWLEDFLKRLVIRPNQPSRADIDAKSMWELHTLWPALSQPELQVIYGRLLDAAVAAQSASCAPASVHVHLAAAWPHVGRRLPLTDEPGRTAVDAIRSQVLSHSMLSALTPPAPGESIEHMLARISAGSAASVMELKMSAGGARPETIRQTQALRADMEIQRQLLLASRGNAEADLERLATSLLMTAQATATRIGMSAAAAPAAAARPAEAIAVDLISRPGDLAQCDGKSLFEGNGHLVYGYLGHLSDTCRFAWRAA